MINVNSVYEFLQFISNKSQSGFLTPKDFNKSISRAVYELITKRYHNVKQQKPDGSSMVGFEQNQKITDDLRYLIVVNEAYKVNNGIITLPNDYLHLSTISYVRNDLDKEGELKSDLINFSILRDSELAAQLSSVLFGKRIKNGKLGVARFIGDKIEIFPKTISTVKLVYLRKPKTPIWGFNVVNNKPVYSASKSTDIELPEDCMNELVFMCASYLGMNLREAELVQYSETLKQQGV